MRLFVGNLSYQTSEADLRRAFEAFGEVLNTTIITDRESGRSRGFGFVEFAARDAGSAAIEALNGQPLDGRNLTVNEAKPREGAARGAGGGGRPRSGQGGERGFGGGYGGDRGFGGGRR